MTCRYGVFISDFPESNNKGKQFFNEITEYINSLDEKMESVWIPDHVAPYLDKPNNEDLIEAYTTISYLSAIHQNKTFGTMVTCNNFRNPALLAKMTANIATMTNNRFILGIGAGWHEKDFTMYGYEFSTIYRRDRQLNEALEIITRLLKEDNVTFEGKYYRVKDAYCYPKPEVPPNIMVGCYGEKYALGMVAKYADIWNLGHLSAETIMHKQGVLASFCDKYSRDYSEILVSSFNNMALADTDDEAEMLYQKSVWRDMPAIIGSPENVASQMGEYLDLGMDYWIIGFLPYHNLESTKLFVEEVIPLL
jgi:alkanesulfonate monooxygenase SsuD/methylene tetrahydromethanopterin reductase-like flavin-dependent oxidoreductase (luciferase family)